MMIRALSIAASLLVASCTCDGDRDLEVEGPHAYFRCLAADPPPEGRHRFGARELVIEGRTLEIEGSAPRVVAFAGRGLPLAAEIARLREARPDLVLMLGGLGDEAEVAIANVRGLSELGAPVLFVAGGRDRRPVATELPTSERFFDVSALELIRVGDLELVPIAGAPEGRYARTDDACGVGEGDLESRARALGGAGEGRRRMLLSWAAPSGEGPDAPGRALVGVDAGWPALARFAEEIGARGGLHAFPAERAGDVSADGHRVLAPLAPAATRADGSSAPLGPILLELVEGELRPAGSP